MSADEDTELRDLIVQTLENNGVIGKIKAELRASVFLALEEDGSLRDKIPLANKKLSDFILTTEGKLAVSLIREFLQFFNLKFTLTVFDPEVSLTSEYFSREELNNKFKLDQVNNEDPILVKILRDSNSKLSHTYSSTQPTFDQPNHAKSLEPKLDSNSNTIIKDADDTDINLNEKNSSYDPFFDEPLPSEPVSVGIFNTQRDNIMPIKKNDEVMANNKTGLNDEAEQSSFLSYLRKSNDDLKLKDKKEENLSNTDSKSLEKKEPSIFALKSDSFSSLKDFPPLTSRSTIDPDWLVNKSQKRILPSLRLDSEPKTMAKIEEINKTDDEQSIDSEQSSKSSLKSVEQSKLKSDVSDISEQSIEESLEEEISGVEDLLSSISVGEESTSDHTVSNISLGGYDYLEKCHPDKKG